VFVKDDATGKMVYHDRNGHLAIHKKRCDVVPVCSPAYLWFTGSQWGVKWYINKVVVPKVYERSGGADLSDMLGMEDMEVVIAPTPAQCKVDEQRPTMAAPTQEELENMFNMA